MEEFESVEQTQVVIPAKSLTLRRFFTFRPPPYKVVKDLVRFSDSSILLCASLVERMPGVQDLLTATYDHNHLLANVVGGCITFGVLNTAQGYKIRVLKNYYRQITRMLVATSFGTVGVYASLAMMHHDQIELLTGSLRWCLLSAAGLGLTRIVTTRAIKTWANAGQLAARVALVGMDSATQTFINAASSHKDTCNIVGIYTDDVTEQAMQGDVKLKGKVMQLFHDSQVEQIDSIVISHCHHQDLTAIYDQVRPVIASIYLIGESIETVQSNKLCEIGGNVVALVEPKPLSDWQRYQKNVFDVTAGSIALVCLSPLIVATAIAIKLDSSGPVLFRQPRDGYNNKPFITYKFRSMYVDQTDLRADKQTTRGDKRITRVGKIIRRFSIDELPQLLNVLTGDMSLVGPRPHAPGTKAGDKLFAEVVKEYPLRHKVKPGITGLAQINGFRGLTPDEESIIQRVHYDLKYIKTWSLWLDIKIIVLTIFREILSNKAF